MDETDTDVRFGAACEPGGSAAIGNSGNQNETIGIINKLVSATAYRKCLNDAEAFRRSCETLRITRSKAAVFTATATSQGS
jgi:hypothetical protein